MRAGRNVNQAWQVHTGLCWNLGLTKVSQSFALEFTSNETKRKQKNLRCPQIPKGTGESVRGQQLLGYWDGGGRTSVGWFLAKHEILILPPEVEDLRKVWVLEISGQGWEPDSHSSEPQKCYCRGTLPYCLFWSDPTPASLSISPSGWAPTSGSVGLFPASVFITQVCPSPTYRISIKVSFS